ncbi:MAG: transglycosylase SLT domain-containing protein [Candidatus Gastranaerophilales bacterium]|nr:transglycosylase SLT domain-containing protein [Candidatus Gastranaerophilales bacterium]
MTINNNTLSVPSFMKPHQKTGSARSSDRYGRYKDSKQDSFKKTSVKRKPRRSNPGVKRKLKPAIKRFFIKAALITGGLCAIIHSHVCPEPIKKLTAEAVNEVKKPITLKVEETSKNLEELTSSILKHDESATILQTSISKNLPYKELKYVENPEQFLSSGKITVEAFRANNPETTKIINKLCKKYGIDEELYYSFMFCESSCRFDALNKKSSDFGPMQLNPELIKLIVKKYFHNDPDMLNIQNLVKKEPNNLKYWEKYFEIDAALIKELKNSNTNLLDVARAYNAGQGYIMKLKNGKSPYVKTEQYAESVILLYDHFKK